MEPPTDSARIESSGTQGWAQFLGAKFEMLDAFDKARREARAHEVETYHGTVAEAQFRQWLTGFLPKRYGVTPGYIISQGIQDERKVPHFDVIIYDQLESPTLWIEGHSDRSEAGKSRAIPAEYVRAVIEVKATLSSTTAKKTVEKLRDLDHLLAETDLPGERYRKYLPVSFFCASVFFDLLKEHQNSQAIMDNLVRDLPARGYIGALVLRAEGADRQYSGKLDLFRHNEPNMFEGGAPQRSLLKTGYSNGMPLPVGGYLFGILLWSPTFFSSFAFDLVALLQGTYEPGRMSSLHAMTWQVGATGGKAKTDG